MNETLTDNALVRGTLLDQAEGEIRLGLTGTNYQLVLALPGAGLPGAGLPGAGAGAGAGLSSVQGYVRVRTTRLDRASAGGRFIEPLVGRPKRMQGRIIAIDRARRTVTLQGPCAVMCQVEAGCDLSRFEAGQLAGFEVKPGAAFEPKG